MGQRCGSAGKGPGEPWTLSLISRAHVVERINLHKLPGDLHRCLSPNKKASGMKWGEMTGIHYVHGEAMEQMPGVSRHSVLDGWMP